MDRECEPPFLSPDECYECVDEWYFRFSEDMREDFLEETLNPFISDKLDEIVSEKDTKERNKLIDELSENMKTMIIEFNIELANLRAIGSDFDNEYRGKLKACETIPLVRKSTRQLVKK